MPEEQIAWSSPRATEKHEYEIKHRTRKNILNCEPSLSGKLDANFLRTKVNALIANICVAAKKMSVIDTLFFFNFFDAAVRVW